MVWNGPWRHLQMGPPARFWTLRRRLLIAGIVVAGVVAIWYVRLPAPLTTAETKLVGTWTLPMPPNPSPKAVQQIFEMRADHTLIEYRRPVATGVKSISRKGSWRLEEGTLVWETQPQDVWKRVVSVMDGAKRLKSFYIIRMRYLGCEDDAFQVEGSDGSPATFERFGDDPQ